MVIVPNFVYYFTFKQTLNSLNGIYNVESILSYAEILRTNIDIFKLTYQANSLSSDIFNADLETIRLGKIAKLISVTDTSVVLYVPEHLFDKVPDGSVQKYFQMGLAVDLGIFDDPEQLSVIRSEIEQIVNSMLGTTNKTVIYTVKNIWMTTDAYQEIANDRETKVTRVSNHYTDKLSLIKQVDSLKTKLAYYETALKALQ